MHLKRQKRNKESPQCVIMTVININVMRASNNQKRPVSYTNVKDSNRT